VDATFVDISQFGDVIDAKPLEMNCKIACRLHFRVLAILLLHLTESTLAELHCISQISENNHNPSQREIFRVFNGLGQIGIGDLVLFGYSIFPSTSAKSAMRITTPLKASCQ
jgi:hypothetical protein